MAKFRIPRMAAASLVLGACGGGNGDGTGGVNTSAARVSKLAEDSCRLFAECGRDGAEQLSQAACIESMKDKVAFYTKHYSVACADARLDLLECSNRLGCEATAEDFDRKCERFAARVSELCEDDATDLDRNDARASKLANDSCRAFAECNPEGLEYEYGNQAECVAVVKQEFADYSVYYSIECGDVFLDWVECSLKLGCGSTDEDLERECDRFLDRVYEVCDFDEYEYSRAPSSRARSYRIPRN